MERTTYPSDLPAMLRETERRIRKLEQRSWVGSVVAVAPVVTAPASVAVPTGTSDAHYRHVQGVAATTWTVNHNLGKFPSVTVVTSTGDEVEGSVDHVSTMQAVLSFATAFSGEAFFN